MTKKELELLTKLIDTNTEWWVTFHKDQPHHKRPLKEVEAELNSLRSQLTEEEKPCRHSDHCGVLINPKIRHALCNSITSCCKPDCPSMRPKEHTPQRWASPGQSGYNYKESCKHLPDEACDKSCTH